MPKRKTRKVTKRKTSSEAQQYDYRAMTLGRFPMIAAPFARTKYYDVNVAGSMTASPSYNPITTIPQGYSQSERIGDVIWIKAISFRYEITTANADIFNLARLIVFSWVPNTTSLTPGTSSVLEDYVSQGVQSFYNYESRQDVKVYYDKLVRMSGTASAPTVASIQEYSGMLTHPGKGIMIQYNPGAITGTRTFYTLVISDSAVTPYPQVNAWFRVYYTDM